MPQNQSIFGEEELQKITTVMPEDENALPLIYTEKKRASKNDSPLEKEIRRFNKLIKELHEYEEEQQKKVVEKEQYDKLFITEIIPHLRDLADLQFLFVRHIEDIFYESNPGKKTEKLFVSFVIDVLEQAAMYKDEARELLNTYADREVNMLSKAERKRFEKWEQAQNEAENFDSFSEENFEQEGEEERFERFSNKKHQQNFVPKEPKVETPVSINELYKELVKIIHPDKEQVAALKEIKNRMMVELNAAKDKADLFTMLRIKQRALKFTTAKTDESNYSLEQLKAYNKVLKQKLELFRGKLERDILGSMFMQNGYIKMKPQQTTATEKLAKELHKLKKVKKDINYNIKIIRTAEDVELMLYNY